VEAGTMEINESTVDLHQLAQNCFDMVYERGESAKLNLHQALSDSPLRVYGDEMRLKQVIINLLSNAIKFTPEGGDVTLKIFTNPMRETVLEVIDTGYGIPKEMHHKVLEPFEQVSDIYTRNHEGSGLGLYLVNSFIKIHGGKVVIDSDVGQGTTVTVVLPAERTRSA